MTRHEKALLIVAAVLLLAAWVLCSDVNPPQTASTNGELPIDHVLWQFRQQMAPPLALVGLACCVSVLFMRAVRWQQTPMIPAADEEPEQEEPAQG
ncbi:hypothetical protein [Parafrigoribacterium soli]|uniref:hypothetical protein n=1 Tax=Parafrigoribacterium soli TaxID=3144663 RepID=UPI0032EACD4C